MLAELTGLQNEWSPWAIVEYLVRSMPEHVLISEPVAEALASGGPVVALETTVVTHGLPRDEGVQAAAELEAVVRAAGAVPATIGVLAGAVRVGMTSGEIAELAASGSAKLNPSNLAAYLATGSSGSTTVAATMAMAARVGIEVFATGGVGGVHRGVAETWDVSADLAALARYPVAVVCAGAKAILDLGKTIEALETQGVPVLGFETDEFPAFYRRSSGMAVDRRCDSVAALARAVRAHWKLGMTTGVVIGNPIPAEFEMPREVYEQALAAALADAAARDVRGRAVTPFLLDRVRELTEGRSVFSNRALLRHNAHVAGQLAAELSRRQVGAG
jgi:pseudouridine-5'-phosphate glycosidase